MTTATENATILTSKIIIKPDANNQFADWQAKLNAEIATQPGFLSLEILSPILPEQPEWLLVQRFNTPNELVDWRVSSRRKKLMEQLNRFIEGDKDIKENVANPHYIKGGVTEVFVAQVIPENEKAYREWIAKIHQEEAKFPGFKGVYMQSPGQIGGTNWITLLQFDTPENLDRWLNSAERKKVLDEAKDLISSLESHRMISPYAGWFASVSKGGVAPPAWKQTMLVLLVLFPIVEFELKYLTLLTNGLNPSFGNFIGNAISATLISWPFMPIAIFFLTWWLIPKKENRTKINIQGTILVLFLYLIELVIFWNFRT